MKHNLVYPLTLPWASAVFPLPLCLRNTIEGSLCALHHTDPLFFFLALKNIVHPFATQHFVDEGSGDIGLAFHTMSMHCKATLAVFSNIQKQQKRNMSPYCPGDSCEDSAVYFLLKWQC